MYPNFPIRTKEGTKDNSFVLVGVPNKEETIKHSKFTHFECFCFICSLLNIYHVTIVNTNYLQKNADKT